MALYRGVRHSDCGRGNRMREGAFFKLDEKELLDVFIKIGTWSAGKRKGGWRSSD